MVHYCKKLNGSFCKGEKYPCNLPKPSLLHQFCMTLQITFKREEESMASSLLNIICYQN